MSDAVDQPYSIRPLPELPRQGLSPVLIAIAPIPSDVAEYVNGLGAKQITEYSAESLPGFYEQIPLSLVCAVWLEALPPEYEEVLYRLPLIEGKTVVDVIRGYQNSEVMFLTLLFSKMISFENFAVAVKQHMFQNDLNYFDELVDYLTCIQELYDSPVHMITETIDLYVQDESSAFESSMKKAMIAIAEDPSIILWNMTTTTNLSASFYHGLLHAAAVNKRSIRFVRWGREIPTVSVYELEYRNLLRFLQTGRICQFRKLCKLVGLSNRIIKSGSATHEDLARAVGYHMNTHGLVYPINDGQRYTGGGGDDGAGVRNMPRTKSEEPKT